MAAVAEIRYVALKPLPLQTEEGERLVLEPGEEVPATLVGRWCDLAVEAGKLAQLAEVGDVASLTDDEFRAEADARGYRLVRKQKD